MRTRCFPWFSLLAGAALTTPAFASEDAFFCVDHFVAGDQADFQGGFAAGEEAAVKIDPPANAFPLAIQSVFVFYGAVDDQNASVEKVRIYAADGQDVLGTDGFPGTLVSEQDAPLVDSTEQVQQITLGSPVLVPTAGPFWVALHFVRGGGSPLPGPANDRHAGGASAMFTNDVDGWQDAASNGIVGNWVIRVETGAATAQSDAACRLDGSGGEGEGAAAGEGEGAGAGEGEGVSGEGEGASGALTITSVNPSTGTQGDDVTVTVTGSGFADGVAVRVGSATCGAVTVQNAGALLCTVPGSLSAGTYDVIAQEGADTFVFPSGFTVSPAVTGCGCASTSDGALLGLVGLVALASQRRRSQRAPA